MIVKSFLTGGVVCFLFTCHTSTFGQTVVSNSNLLIGSNPRGFKSAVYQDAAATDQTVGVFIYNGTMIQSDFISPDEGSDWYVVHSGDVFSRATIAAGDFTPLVTFGPTYHPPVNVSSGDLYLGINTGVGIDIPEDRTAYGWVHLRPNNFGILTMVENVMSYDSLGIIVGTTTLVPEPATLTMGLGLYFLILTSTRLRAEPPNKSLQLTRRANGRFGGSPPQS
jgi:hypothetical protein